MTVCFLGRNGWRYPVCRGRVDSKDSLREAESGPAHPGQPGPPCGFGNCRLHQGLRRKRSKKEGGCAGAILLPPPDFTAGQPRTAHSSAAPSSSVALPLGLLEPRERSRFCTTQPWGAGLKPEQGPTQGGTEEPSKINRKFPPAQERGAEE